MDVAIVYKWAPNPEDAIIKDDASLMWRRSKLVASDDDAAAIACARQIAEETGGELVAVTIGDGDATWALARGASRAVSVPDFTLSDDDAITARCLQLALKSAGDFDLVVMGDMQSHAGVAPALAALLGIPALISVDDVAVDPNNASAVIGHRRAPQAIETVRASLPALAAVSAVRTETNVPGIKQQLAAKKLPVEKISAEDAGEVGRTTVAVSGARLPEKRVALRFDGSLAEQVGQLLDELEAKSVL